MERRWHFLLPTPLTPEEEIPLAQQIKAALSDWRTHGTPVRFEVRFPYRHFVEIITHQPISGCAQDYLHRTLLPLLKPLPTQYVAIIENEKIKINSFHEIIKRHATGAWDASWLIIESGASGLEARRLEDSQLAIHL